MEGRLPFDQPPPNYTSHSSSSKTPHRIARCEWYWWEHGDGDGTWDPDRQDAPMWQGAKEVVEGLLKKLSRGRMSLDVVAESQWVTDVVKVPRECLQTDNGLRD